MLPRPTPPAAHRSHVGTAANEQWAIDTATETAEAARVVIIGGRHQCFHLTAVTDEGSSNGVGSGGGDPDQEEGTRRLASHGGGRALPADTAGGRCRRRR